MKWKDFPSPFLATMEGQKTLSSRWRPCLSDPFSTDLLPLMPDPPQLDGPQQDDLETLDWYPISTFSTVCIYLLPFSPESSDPLPRVTEEMLRAEFYIPDTTDEPLCTRLTIQRTCTCLLLPNYFCMIYNMFTCTYICHRLQVSCKRYY